MRRAFTLLELMVLLAVLTAVLAAMTVPAFQRMGEGGTHMSFRDAHGQNYPTLEAALRHLRRNPGLSERILFTVGTQHAVLAYERTTVAGIQVERLYVGDLTFRLEDNAAVERR